ncbi:hypothetical protein CKF54_04370 [Psittacicella hinzii]|uniref:Uncharacterized protein n=1 Tax=Psittacicella hinzii TaxID=2028575 RepID=A0A3A1Y5Z0_9GAMM|nr:hypothetical protein [Psittacicella hinzii]RIY32696.1 hypothetical protein CKF54_04370 [Psittacicella hinzii]
MLFSTPNFVIIAMLVAFRATHNFRDPRFSTFALSATVIFLELISSALSPNFFYSSFLQLNPYKPLFVVTSYFLLGFAFYHLISSQWLHQRIRRRYPGFTQAATLYAREVVIVTEIIASFLAYLSLSDFAQFSSWLVASSSRAQEATSNFWFIAIVTLIVVRFFYNLLLGNYKTFVFWSVSIIFFFTYTLIGHREYFATNTFLYVYAVSYIFRYIATEENFYNFFARTKLSEARFAMLLHGLTALAELIASLMILGIFVNSYTDLTFLKSYF